MGEAERQDVRIPGFGEALRPRRAAGYAQERGERAAGQTRQGSRGIGLNGTREMKFPIYLDYSATTPVDPRVAQKMIPFLTEQFGNAASRSHAFGWEAEKAGEEARGHVAALLNADSKETIWTSGATEGNHHTIKGAANFYKGKGKLIV